MSLEIVCDRALPADDRPGRTRWPCTAATKAPVSGAWPSGYKRRALYERAPRAAVAPWSAKLWRWGLCVLDFSFSFRATIHLTLQLIMGDSSDKNPIVLLGTIAANTGYNPAGMKKAAVRRGYEPQRLGPHQNSTLYLPKDEADKLEADLLRDADIQISQPYKDTDKMGTSSGISGIYVVVVPSFDGSRRLKIGLSDNIDGRLDNYRTTTPDLITKGIYPTTATAHAEWAALQFARQHGKAITNELFEFENIDEFMTKLDAWFAKIGIRNQETGATNAAPSASPFQTTS